jgi:hypothetical protein
MSDANFIYIINLIDDGQGLKLQVISHGENLQLWINSFEAFAESDE